MSEFNPQQALSYLSIVEDCELELKNGWTIRAKITKYEENEDGTYNIYFDNGMVAERATLCVRERGN